MFIFFMCFFFRSFQLRFVCGEALDVEVFLSNPLQVPMLVQHMSLSTSGVAFEAFTASLTLPPGRCTEGEPSQQPAARFGGHALCTRCVHSLILRAPTSLCAF